MIDININNRDALVGALLKAGFKKAKPETFYGGTIDETYSLKQGEYIIEIIFCVSGDYINTSCSYFIWFDGDMYDFSDDNQKRIIDHIIKTGKVEYVD